MFLAAHAAPHRRRRRPKLTGAPPLTQWRRRTALYYGIDSPKMLRDVVPNQISNLSPTWKSSLRLCIDGYEHQFPPSGGRRFSSELLPRQRLYKFFLETYRTSEELIVSVSSANGVSRKYNLWALKMSSTICNVLSFIHPRALYCCLLLWWFWQWLEWKEHGGNWII